MSNHAGLKLALVALAVGAGTYFTLTWLKPYRHVEVKMEGLVPAEQVFDAEPLPGAASDAASSEAEAPAASEPAAPPPASTSTPEPEAKPAANAASEAAGPVVSEAPAVSAPAPEKKPTAKASSASSAPVKAASPKGESSEGREAWWQSTSSSGFNVVYAGSAAFRRALVVMGNAPFANADSANAAIKVFSAKGKPVVGSWELNAVNASMLVFPLSDTGLYRVQIGAGLSDRQNRALGTALQGTIRVE